jgi:SulP family sulfate permease
MKFMRKISHQLEIVKKLELCPSVLNVDIEKYSFAFLANDILCGIRIFLMLFPIASALTFFCGTSPIQGVISCAVASMCSIIIGGSKYQIPSIAIPLCVVIFEISAKYQYKGLLFASIFVSAILIIFGLLRFSDVLKYLSGAYVAALVVCVTLFIIVHQIQYILGIDTVQHSQSFIENFNTLKANIKNVNMQQLIGGALFLLPLLLIRLKIRSHFSFFWYLCLGAGVVLAQNYGIVPFLEPIKTVGSEFLNAQVIDNITTISKEIPSQTFLINILNYAFAISIVIATEACFCTNVASSITGDRKLQANAEIISSGIANFISVACGGLMVSPNLTLTMQNISYKAKTIIGLLAVCFLSFAFVKYAGLIIGYIPVHCISAILIVFATSTFFSKEPLQYLNFKHYESYIFLATVIAALYFGFIPAVIIGFTTSMIFFSKRMVKIKDASVHSTKNHDTGAIEFMSNKNGLSKSINLPKEVMDRIEVIQINNILFLNITKLVEESLSNRGSFPDVIILYFKNVPFLDTEAMSSLKYVVRKAKDRECTVIVSGTNGMLLEILRQKEEEENLGHVFGYIVPNFREAIKKVTERMK